MRKEGKGGTCIVRLTTSAPSSSRVVLLPRINTRHCSGLLVLFYFVPLIVLPFFSSFIFLFSFSVHTSHFLLLNDYARPLNGSAIISPAADTRRSPSGLRAQSILHVHARRARSCLWGPRVPTNGFISSSRGFRATYAWVTIFFMPSTLPHVDLMAFIVYFLIVYQQVTSKRTYPRRCTIIDRSA